VFVGVGRRGGVRAQSPPPTMGRSGGLPVRPKTIPTLVLVRAQGDIPERTTPAPFLVSCTMSTLQREFFR
jgi:hypothetical protein